MRIFFLAFVVSTMSLPAFAGPAVSTGTGERAALQYDDYLSGDYRGNPVESRKEDIPVRPVQYQPQVQEANQADIPPVLPAEEATP